MGFNSGFKGLKHLYRKQYIAQPHEAHIRLQIPEIDSNGTHEEFSEEVSV